MTKRVFLTGATGYIGGTVLMELINDKRYLITAMVRSEANVKKIEATGASAVIGSYDKPDALINAVKEYDVSAARYIYKDGRDPTRFPIPDINPHRRLRR
jgi:uncharacterized protein YbjT (DUF2867 family)